MQIRRDIYLNRLIEKRHNGLVKIITGLRRCGKSYLLFEIFKNWLIKNGVPQSRIIEIKLDDYANKGLRKPDAIYRHIKKKIKGQAKHYILLDEVQLLEDFAEVLNGLLHIPNADIYVTGSNAKFLSKDIATEFRGRGDEMRLNPLSFMEFMSVFNGSRQEGFTEYMTFGGLPAAALMTSPQAKAEYLKKIFSETYLIDLLERNRIKKTEELETITDMLASASGSLTNPKKIADSFASIRGIKINQSTVKKYIGHLCDAFIISEAKRYDVKGKKYLSTPLKYYFADTGLRNARLNFRQLEETHAMENIIYNELLARQFNVDIGITQANIKNSLGKSERVNYEIDFVANLGFKRYYIQSAFAIPDRQKMIQEERPLMLAKDSFKKIIVQRNSVVPYYTQEGVLIIGIEDFLLNPASMDL